MRCPRLRCFAGGAGISIRRTFPESLFFNQNNTVISNQSSSLRLNLLGTSVPAEAAQPFPDILAEWSFLAAIGEGANEPAVQAQAGAMHRLLAMHRPADRPHLDHLLWLVRAVTTAALSGPLTAAREFLTGETLCVLASPTSWLDHARESALVACLETLGGVPGAAGEAGAASRLAAAQRRYEGEWLRSQSPSEQQRAAFELLGHYHLSSAMLRLARFRTGKSNDTAQAHRESFRNAFMNVGLAYGRADQVEMTLAATLVQGACQALL